MPGQFTSSFFFIISFFKIDFFDDIGAMFFFPPTSMAQQYVKIFMPVLPVSIFVVGKCGFLLRVHLLHTHTVTQSHYLHVG